MKGGGHGADRGADRRGRTRATALGGQGAVAPQPRPCRTSNDEKRVPRTRTVIRTHSAARGEARLTAEPASLAPASPTPDARRRLSRSALQLHAPPPGTSTSAVRAGHVAPHVRLACRQLAAAARRGRDRDRARPRRARSRLPTGAGRDFDLPRHSHYSRVIPIWCFNIVGGEILTFPDPCPRHSLRHSHYSRETQGLSLGIDPMVNAWVNGVST